MIPQLQYDLVLNQSTCLQKMLKLKHAKGCQYVSEWSYDKHLLQ